MGATAYPVYLILEIYKEKHQF